ncbi:MAG: hypothetical protein R3D58_09000 [Saprospiraceae bacterium]|jgi:hypothetical protein|nr:hypothetical protein [Lewinellaceae bacterium]
MKYSIVLAVALSVCPLSLFAQAQLQPSPQILDAMKKIRVLEGDWAGSGWIQMGPQRHEFHQAEHVRFHANGTALTIDGRGTDASDSTQVIHQAFAVISYDQQAGKYLMRAIRADGNHVDADFAVQPDGNIIWGFSHPMAGQIRYTIQFTDGKWIETGAMSRDGSTWMPFFEMQLEKL